MTVLNATLLASDTRFSYSRADACLRSPRLLSASMVLPEIPTTPDVTTDASAIQKSTAYEGSACPQLADTTVTQLPRNSPADVPVRHRPTTAVCDQITAARSMF